MARRCVYDRDVKRLAGKSIVVTGGSSGLGRAMALRFAAEGADVVVGDLRDEPREGGPPTVDVIEQEGGRATFVRSDASRAEDIDLLVGTAVERTGRLDVMVPNAIVAGPHSKGLLETSEADWDAIMAVGLRGVFLCCRAAVRQMLTQEPVAEARGRIVAMSSQHGMVGAPDHLAYCAAKGGVVNLTRQIAVDFGPRGIICNAVAPGKILTTPIDEPDTPEGLAYSRLRTPFARLGRPGDVASLAVFLASDECTYMSGANVLVDGGWMAY
jgi:glucose 1-dehydrogenase